LLFCPVPPWILDTFTIARDNQMSDTHVDANLSSSGVQWLRLNLTRETSIPLACLSLDAQCFDLTLDFSMPPHCYTPNAKYPETMPINLESIAILLQSKRIKAAMSLEPWIAGCFSCFHTSEECLECLI